MGPRVGNRNIAYKVGRPGGDLWAIFGTFVLVVFVFTFAMIVWQGRHTPKATSQKTPTDHIVLVASPQPTNVATPTPDSTPTPAPTSAPAPQPQLVNTGADQQRAPTAPLTRGTAPPTARPTPTPKPTATHQAPTAILKVIAGGLKGAQVTGDASFSWDATGIASYHFNWGDGITSGPQPDPVATHTYSSSGTWTITLTVVDSWGLYSATSTTVTVG